MSAGSHDSTNCRPSLDLCQAFDLIGTGLIILDEDLTIVLWNRWMEQHSRLSKDQVVGRNIQDIFPEIRAKGFAWKAQSVFKMGTFAFFSQKVHQYLFPLFSEKYLDAPYDYMQQSVTLAPVRDEDGEVSHICVSVMDETDQVNIRDRLEQATIRLEEMSSTDYLTGLYNRRHFIACLSEELSRHARTCKPLSLAIVDMDHFKSINDTYGHLCGDHVLTEAAQLFSHLVRPYDKVCRYGGEEFCILLPNTGMDDARLVLERLRHGLENTPFSWEGQSISLTISAGLASTERVPEADVDTLIRHADTALYKAKDGGRNRILLHSSELPE